MPSVPVIDPAQLNGYSEQSAIELIYVQAANQVLGEHMDQLERALKGVTGILGSLTNLQNAKNQIHISSRSVPAYTSANFSQIASTVFGSQILPSLIASFDYSTILDYKNDLKDQLDQLLRDLPSGEASSLQSDPNSIYVLAQKVIADIGNSQSSAESWVMDHADQLNQGTTAQASAYQNDLSQAITAGTAINDQKKQEAQQFLYVFQEYYKSASSILTQLTQILQDIARNVGKD